MTRSWWVAIARILLGLPLHGPVGPRTAPVERQDTCPVVTAALSPVHPPARHAGGTPTWIAAWDRWADTVHGPDEARRREEAA